MNLQFDCWRQGVALKLTPNIDTILAESARAAAESATCIWV
ncbi:hypothetical protein [Nostoc sp.]